MKPELRDIAGGKQAFHNGGLLLTILISEGNRVRLTIIAASGDIRFRGVIRAEKLQAALDTAVELELKTAEAEASALPHNRRVT